MAFTWLLMFRVQSSSNSWEGVSECNVLFSGLKLLRCFVNELFIVSCQMTKFVRRWSAPRLFTRFCTLIKGFFEYGFYESPEMVVD